MTIGADELRRFMGAWATGVSVITAEGADGPAGATANALSSLSLEPPLVLACFDLSSRTLSAVRDSERFCINILAEGQESVSTLFATKKSQEEKFAEVEHRSVQGTPVIAGCLAYLVCTLDSELRRGDHVIAIGCVVEGAMDETLRPLLFYRSNYRLFPEERALTVQ
jgi:flavin reductase (DIM6/NTAB) family NADH-FMN oxidoreductase RutF